MGRENASKRFLICIIFSAGTLMASVVSSEELSREQIMDREMNCISERMQTASTIDWQDVCYTNPSHQGPVDYFPEDEREAYEESETYSETKKYQTSLTNFEIGGEASVITYEEPGVMKEKGEMYGVFASLTHRISLNEHIDRIQDVFSDENKINMFRLEGKISGGEVNYQSQGTGAIKYIDDYMIEGRALAGYDVPIFIESRITPYLGIGYRYLNDNTGGRVSTTGHAGYEREANYVYLPIGFESNFPINEGWSWGATFEYDVFLGGKQKSHFFLIQSQTNKTRDMGLKVLLGLLRLMMELIYSSSRLFVIGILKILMCLRLYLVERLLVQGLNQKINPQNTALN
jgi:hypothetical protein